MGDTGTANEIRSKTFLGHLLLAIGQDTLFSVSREVILEGVSKDCLPVMFVKEGEPTGLYEQMFEVSLLGAGNGYSSKTTLRAACIAVTMHTYNHLAFNGQDDEAGDLYHSLAEWVYVDSHDILTASEISAIYWFLD